MGVCAMVCMWGLEDNVQGLVPELRLRQLGFVEVLLSHLPTRTRLEMLHVWCSFHDGIKAGSSSGEVAGLECKWEKIPGLGKHWDRSSLGWIQEFL